MADERELSHEEIADLQRLWRSEQPRPAGGDLADADAATRRAVECLQRAWREVEVPEPRVPAPVRRPRFGRIEWIAGLAAAVLLSLLVLSVLRDGLFERELADARETRGGLAQAEDAGLSLESGGAQDVPDRGPRVASIGEGHLEVRSGPVTLVLATSTTPHSPVPAAPGPEATQDKAGPQALEGNG